MYKPQCTAVGAGSILGRYEVEAVEFFLLLKQTTIVRISERELWDRLTERWESISGMDTFTETEGAV